MAKSASSDAEVRQILNSIKSCQGISKPFIEFEIDVEETISAMINYVKEWLENYTHLHLDDNIAEVLKYGITLQVYAKEYKSRLTTPFGDHLEFEGAYIIRDTFKPVAHFIDQIGKFALDGQTFVPKLKFPVYTQNRELGEAYVKLMLRIPSVKHRTAELEIVTIDFTNHGSEAQLVGCRKNAAGGRQVWASRNISKEKLLLGLAYGFGKDSTSKSHDREVAACAALAYVTPLMIFSKPWNLSDHTVDKWIPDLTVEIKVEETISKIVAVTVAYLEHRNVRLSTNDADVLKHVLTSQVREKVGVSSQLIYSRARFSRTLKSTALFLDQIGEFVLNGQKFIPKLIDGEELPKELPDDIWRKTPTRSTTDTGTEFLYVRRDVDPGNDPTKCLRLPSEHLRWVDDRQMITKLQNDYADLLSRISETCSGSSAGIVSIDYGKPGTAAQLVGCRELELRYGRDTPEHEAWACRKISTDMLALGAVYGFGKETNSKLHSEQLAACTTNVVVPVFYQRIMGLNEVY